jgi:hypothetical protein
MEQKIKRGMKVRCPKLGDDWATVNYVSPSTGRVEIKYPGAGYVIEVKEEELTMTVEEELLHELFKIGAITIGEYLHFSDLSFAPKLLEMIQERSQCPKELWKQT